MHLQSGYLLPGLSISWYQRINGLKPAGLPGNPHREQVPAGPAPVQEIPAGAEIIFHNIGSGLSFNHKKVQVFFDPARIDRIKG